MTETKKTTKRRCEQKIITSEIIALRKIRELLGLDRKTADLILNKSPKQLEKIESGRVELSQLGRFISGGGYAVISKGSELFSGFYSKFQYKKMLMESLEVSYIFLQNPFSQ